MIRVFLYLCPILLFGTDSELDRQALAQQARKDIERYKQEAKALAQEEHRAKHQEILSFHKTGRHPLFSQRDLVPTKDRDKSLELDELSNEEDWGVLRALAQQREQENGDLHALVQGAQKESAVSAEYLEDHAHIDPKEVLGIVSEETHTIPAETKLVKCQEVGTFVRIVPQQRRVVVTHFPAKTHKVCLGHTIEDKVEDKKGAKWLRQHKEQWLSTDPSIHTYSQKIRSSYLGWGDYTLYTQYTHHLDTARCDHFRTDVVQPEQWEEEDHWEPLSSATAQELDWLSSHPECAQTHILVEGGPSSKVIEGKEVVRPHWTRKLVFSCEGKKESPCSLYRDQGFPLVGRTCLQEMETGGCALWEKSYDLGKQAAKETTTYAFNEEPILGAEGFNELHDYEKNGEFGRAATQLSLLSDLKKNIENEELDFNHSTQTPQVFKGEAQSCENSFLGGLLFECCQKMQGVAIQAQLAKCSEEEQCLAKQRSQGKCHFVGAKRSAVTTKKGFCCFPTRLARLLQEQGREQLQKKGFIDMGWGTVDKPNCRGFSVEELRQIDFSQLNLMEVAQELGVEETQIIDRLKQITPSAEAIEQRTKQCVKGGRA